MRKYTSLICLIWWLTGCQATQKEAPNDLRLWYAQPAQTWTEALPLGNGSMGAMVYGGVHQETIQFNEETLWTGSPREYPREGASAYLPGIRNLLQEGKQEEAEALAEAHFMGLKSQEDTYEKDRNVWLKSLDNEAARNLLKENAASENWKTMAVPVEGGWENAGLDGVDGAIWFKKSFELPESWTHQDVLLSLGRIRDLDHTYINGKKVGSTNGKDEQRVYKISQELLHDGENVISIQVINFTDKGGLTGRRNDQPLSLKAISSEELDKIDLSGNWHYKIQDENPPAFPEYEAAYQPFGDLVLQFQQEGGFQKYSRSLDLETAVSTVDYEQSGVQYHREYFMSEPQQAFVGKINASRPASISLKATLDSPHRNKNIETLDSQTLSMTVRVKDGALEGNAQLYIRANGGKVKIENQQIVVDQADEVYLMFTAATNFRNYQDISGDAFQNSKTALERAKTLDYDQLKKLHKEEYQSYFNQLSISLGENPSPIIPTNERLNAFSKGQDPALAALYLQYGRYLLISSSRPGTQPANLQGIWNDELTPPWDSKYTTNINLEMNYWPAEVLNLSACHQPLLTMIQELSQQGKKTAQAHYDARGWVTHHNTDLWRGTAPINASNHGIWVTGGAWLCEHLWSHFQFTQDTTYLRDTAYPIMKEAARFFVDFLVEDPDTGWLISSPSNSPENGGLVAGPTMDHQIIRSLFENCMEAEKVLKLDDQFYDTLQNMHSKLAPNQIGQFGQLQEWLQDQDDTTNRHRHVSHLWGVHPGNQISWEENPKMMEAARQSLRYRGDGGTGWSLAWKINLWDKFQDGPHAYKMLATLLSPVDQGGGSYPNLFDAHPPFQIDGNFGGASGIAAMFLQSQQETIHLLPALPEAFAQGEIEGLRARGGFEVDLRWNQGELEQVIIKSSAGKPCHLRYGDLQVSFETVKEEIYTFDKQLQLI